MKLAVIAALIRVTLMYTLILSIVIGVLIAVIPILFGVSSSWTILPGIIVSVAVFVLVSRRVAKRVEAVTQGAQQDMAKAQNIAQRAGTKAPEIMHRAIDSAVAKLKTGLLFSKWQIGVTTMINAQIGMLLYTKAQVMQQAGQKAGLKAAFKATIPYLTASQVSGAKAKLMHQLWPAWAMLAVAHFRTEGGIDKAVEVLEAAVKVAPKPALLWSLYAWLLWKSKRLDDAIGVLARAKESADEDKHLKENISLLQNRKPMKMRGYGEQWYQFGLEQPRMAANQARMGHPRMRGNSRRR